MTRILLAAMMVLTGATFANAFPSNNDAVVRDAVRHGSQISLHGVFDAQ